MYSLIASEKKYDVETPILACFRCTNRERYGKTEPMIQSFKMISFLHEEENISAKFLCSDQESKESALSYFDLCFLHLLAYFKDKEQMCVYFNDDNQSLNYKIEASPQGQFRSLLMADEEKFNPLMTGNIRQLKFLPDSNVPSESILRAENSSPREMINEVLHQSYQIESAFCLQADQNQSLLISSLPQKKGQHFSDYVKKNENAIMAISMMDTSDPQRVQREFDRLGFTHLMTTDYYRSCPCSKEYMIKNIEKLSNENIKEIFKEEGKPVDANCDYCQKTFSISLGDLSLNL